MVEPRQTTRLELFVLGTHISVMLALFVICMLVSTLNRKLYTTENYCYRGWFGKKCQDLVSGCQWTNDNSNTVPCDHCDTVAMISGVVQFFGMYLALLLVHVGEQIPQFAAATVACGPLIAVCSCFHVVWFAVAGTYFTKMRLDFAMLPKNDNRHSIVYLMWAGVALACVQLILAAATFAMRKKLQPEAQKMKQQQQGLEGVQLNGTVLPLLPRHPKNAPEGYMPLPPSPLGGYPYNVPAPPAGGYPSTAPGCGVAPHLGGQVNSTAVLPGSGGTAQAVPPQQPTV